MPSDTSAGSGQAAVIHVAVMTRANHGARSRQKFETGGRNLEARLREAVSLAGAIGLAVAHAEAIELAAPRPATLIGQGKLAMLKTIAEANRLEVVIVDATLSAIQQRNLERALSCKVIDRTGLILEIFAARAKTREGRLQVELARLNYQKSRLVRSWTHLERQRGGFGFLGGPGETQIEADRRIIRERIAHLKRELDAVVRTRALHREARRRVPYPVIALVGYTNAGKSTLFNRLTGASVDMRDQLFATLDPTMRGIDLPSGRRVILSDTVGFVSDLPHDLVAAFRATLEEVVEADIIIHVRDISHPDSEAQARDVEAVLGELGGEERPLKAARLEVLNKMDRLGLEDQARIEATLTRQGDRVAVSALTGAGIAPLLAALDALLAVEQVVVTLRLSHADGAGLAWLYRHGEVLERRGEEAGEVLRVALGPADLERVLSRPGVEELGRSPAPNPTGAKLSA